MRLRKAERLAARFLRVTEGTSRKINIWNFA